MANENPAAQPQFSSCLRKKRPMRRIFRGLASVNGSSASLPGHQFDQERSAAFVGGLQQGDSFCVCKQRLIQQGAAEQAGCLLVPRISAFWLA